MKKLTISMLAIGALFVVVSTANAGWVCMEFCCYWDPDCIDACLQSLGTDRS